MRAAAASSDGPFEEIDHADRATAGQSRARSEGAAFDEVAFAWLERAGAEIRSRAHKVAGIPVDGRIRGINGLELVVLAHGNIDVDGGSNRPGLCRTDTVHKAGDRAFLLHQLPGTPPVLMVTSHLPDPAEHRQAAFVLAMHRSCVFDAVATVGDLAGFQRVQRYLTARPVPTSPDETAPWRFVPGEQLALDAPIAWEVPDA